MSQQTTPLSNAVDSGSKSKLVSAASYVSRSLSRDGASETLKTIKKVSDIAVIVLGAISLSSIGLAITVLGVAIGGPSSLPISFMLNKLIALAFISFGLMGPAYASKFTSSLFAKILAKPEMQE